MLNFIKNFRKDDSGAVTVDWVVLTAAVVILAGVVYNTIEAGATNLASETGTFLQDFDPAAADTDATSDTDTDTDTDA